MEEKRIEEERKSRSFALFLPFVWCGRFVRFLYDWVLSWAHSRFGTLALVVLSFSESSFFPIPPDVLQIALSIERPKRSFFYAGVSALASTIGAALGWYIGFALWDTVGGYFVPAVFSQENMDKVTGFFQEYGLWVLFAAAFTPIPFKVFTITSGVVGMSLPAMLVASLIGRSARFFLMGTLIYVFGPKIKDWIDKYFGWLTILFVVLLIGGFYCAKFIF
ncbi:MAG: DedA family protein [Thermoguttaceae bacterium]|nr:DedA family protein [Thermoguttaceae bacterium]